MPLLPAMKNTSATYIPAPTQVIERLQAQEAARAAPKTVEHINLLTGEAEGSANPEYYAETETGEETGVSQ